MIEAIKKLKEEISSLKESIEAYNKHAEHAQESVKNFTEAGAAAEKQKQDMIAALDLVETAYYKQQTG